MSPQNFFQEPTPRKWGWPRPLFKEGQGKVSGTIVRHGLRIAAGIVKNDQSGLYPMQHLEARALKVGCHDRVPPHTSSWLQSPQLMVPDTLCFASALAYCTFTVASIDMGGRDESVTLTLSVFPAVLPAL